MSSPKSGAFHLVLILLAFFFWGITPLYFKWLDHISAVELVVHRIIWSSVVLWGLLYFSGLWREFLNLWKDKQARNRLLITSVMISANWLVFVYAVLSGQTVEASLGYYINPLVSIALGGLFLGERLTKVQVIAVTMASAGVIAEVWTVGNLSWIACSLAISFALYGLSRKKLTVHPMIALAVETSWMVPVAVIALFIGTSTGNFVFFNDVSEFSLPLMLAGVVTVVPLLLYVSGLPGVTLITAGFAQYIAPSMVFILALTWFGEEVPSQRFYTFGLIWLALFVITLEGMVKMKAARK